MADTHARMVCLLDDDSSVRRSVTRLLESTGFTVEAFSEPSVFLAYLASHDAPVVILDIYLRSATGMQLLNHLCARSPQSRTIFITSDADDDAAEAEATAAGAYAFFAKPLDAERFLDAVHRAFTAARSPALAGGGESRRRKGLVTGPAALGEAFT